MVLPLLRFFVTYLVAPPLSRFILVEILENSATALLRPAFVDKSYLVESEKRKNGQKRRAGDVVFFTLLKRRRRKK